MGMSDFFQEGILRQNRFLFLALMILASLGRSAPSYGTLRVSSASAIIYHGADLNANEEGVAPRGSVFLLRAASLIHGFYKIEYKGHVSYINSGDVVLLDSKGNPIDEGDEDVLPSPTPRVTISATKAPTNIPTKVLTNIPTKMPTLVVTKVISTPLVSVVVPPVPIKTVGDTQIDQERQATPQSTLVPTRAATLVATINATRVSTLVPTAYPTRAPTFGPTAYPTRVSVVAPIAVATPLTRQGRGKALPSRNQARGVAGGVLLGQAMFKTQVAHYNGPSERKEGQLSAVMLYLPLGGGNCVAVQPAFKPNPGTADCRCIESSGFVGLGAEMRVARWLRVFGDWTAYQHKTKAADKGVPAPLVNVPGGGNVLLDTNAFYVMETQGLRLGLKASLPFPHVEPYVGAGLGKYFWSAQYMDSDRSVTYGDDKGVAFGVTGLLGVDFTFNYGQSGVFRVGPFVEVGAPVVNPRVKDIAGLGVEWIDTVGTPVMLPVRYGILFGVGF